MMPNATRSFAALRRFAQPPKHAPEKCELCGQAIGPEHPHLLELSSRTLKCSCHPCSMLFPAGATVKYRHVPRDGQILADFVLSDSDWERLQTPIGLAFFVRHSGGNVVGYYPSPAGATVSDLPDDAWKGLVAANPVLAEMEPDVEALLVYRVRDTREYYRAPIDVCYELVGLIRSGWRGLSGGSAVWDSIERFFARVKERWHA